MPALQDVEIKYKKADRALRDGDPATAARLLRELVKAEPKEPLFRWSLGYAYSEMEEYGSAIPELKEALKLDPQNIAALGCLGRVYMELGKWAFAEKAFRKRLAIKESPQHFVFLAHVMMEKRQYDDAIDNCRKAVELDESFEEAYLNLGVAYRHKKRFDDAIGAFQKAIELDSRYAAAYRELGLTYYAVSKFDLAKNALRTCAQLEPADAWNRVYLALTLQATGDFKGAAKAFDEATRTDPENGFIKKKRQEFRRLHMDSNGSAAQRKHRP
jgi:superkiller protein 3